ncbi:tryptophan halogenase family protein [Undibacterium fentianense]|uniref:Tryptophan 7-halogenase n=1 Tax=Undibacterium fentianense TaxID=2828728 RepID=A0A941IFU2_9BURK|nr:tryptophan halogenase family protein [Undibacterium fentianense]MBR7799365.1 tryptophan 7-halogenase [Undibacterium fentianense]
MKVKQIAIIGGGTAGWLVANHLAVELRAESDIEITVIESPEIGIIGVGEGTVPHIKKSLQKFGISEADLLATCDATFKVGIKFVDWMEQSKEQSSWYYHPFASPFPGGVDATALYQQHAHAMQFSDFCESATLAESLRSPKQISSLEYEGEVNYAYHFNAVKFGQLLAKNAREKWNVKHQHATIIGAQCDELGAIQHVIYKDGQRQAFDFYVDCSGFQSILLGKALNVKLIDKSSQILTDSALAVQIPTTSNASLAPYTLAKAHSAGWIWDIPLINRRGVGFVYSSAHLSESQAIEGLSHYLQIDADQLSPRKIPMRMGYREKFWHQNVVALGLAQGFVEPLEATSIFVTDFAAELFASHFSTNKENMSIASEYCNRVVTYAWERVIDFVQLHYYLSNRKDSDFWIDNTKNSKLSDVLSERLAMWRFISPKKSDFFSRFDLFDVDNFLFVLYGMKFNTRDKTMTTYEEQYFRKELDKIRQRSHRLSKELLDHRDWLNQFHHAYKTAFERR